MASDETSRTPRELLEMTLSVGTDDWTPTPHGKLLGETLAAHNLVRGREVLELGAGVGNHTIVLVRQGAKRVVATEITKDRLDTARRNVERNCPDTRVVEYRVADWLHTDGVFDVVVSNPPFARSGKLNRRYFIDSLILDAHKRLRDGGLLVFVQSSMADLAKTRARLQENGYDVELLATSQGPFRDYYYEDETFMQEVETVENGYELRDGVHWETLYVIAARLQPWTPPDGDDRRDSREGEEEATCA